MATLSAFLGNAVAPTTIELNGKVYRPRRLTLGLLTELEQWLVDRARNEFVKTMAELFRAGVYSQKEVTEEIKSFVRSVVDEGQYSFGSPAMESAMGIDKNKPNPDGTADPNSPKKIEGNVAGQMRLIALVLGCPDDEVLELFTHRQAEVMAFIQQLTTESLPAPKA